MSRSAPIIPVNAKMYRHFAIATVMITATLAMFASGENREALQDRLDAKQQQLAMQQAEQQNAAKKGKKANFTDKRKVKGRFGSESDIRWRPPPGASSKFGYAESVQAELVAGSEVTFSGSGAGAAGAGGGTLAAPPPPGMSPAEYEQMLNQKKKKKPPPKQRAMTAQEQEAMLAASDARSQTRRD